MSKNNARKSYLNNPITSNGELFSDFKSVNITIVKEYKRDNLFLDFPLFL